MGQGRRINSADGVSGSHLIAAYCCAARLTQWAKADISAHRELVQKYSTPRAPFELRDQIAASTFAALRIDSGA